LTSIRSLSEILKNRPELAEEKKQEFFTILAKESTRLSRLIDEVLDFQRLEKGQMEWNYESIVIQDLIKETIQIIKPLIEHNKIILIEAKGLEKEDRIWGDVNTLKQVILNLLSNAIKFKRHERATIIVSCQQKGPEMIISIVDNGIGIDPAKHTLIFEEFNQGLSAQRDKPKGSGLGLAISKRILAAHNGKIWVKSAIGQGSTFNFSLPISKEIT